jgi:methionine sulfoxide reductase catalytic subunit
MIPFDDAHRKVHYPNDRRFRVWVRPSILIGLLVLALAPVVLALVQNAVFGLPYIAPSPASHEGAASGPHGFPFWIRWSHFFNMVFLFMLIRSGLSILVDHPRLYLNDHCTPGSEWIRFTPLTVPTDRVWTAKDDARYISPMMATPGYRHTVGVARSWHFISVYGFVLTGVFFVAGLLTSDQWRRLVPTSPSVFVQAWNTFVYYANFRFPPEPNGFYGYNALQQLAYFATIFIMAPLSILTGMAMSPALVNRFPAYAKLFGGRQAARSLHFLMLVGFVGFIVVHVALVVLTGFARNMNHIVRGTGRLAAHGNRAGADWYLAGRAFMGSGPLHLLVLSARLAACPKGDHPTGETRHSGSSDPERALYPSANLPALLAQRQNARPGRLAATCRRQLQEVPAEGRRSGGEPGRMVS